MKISKYLLNPVTIPLTVMILSLAGTRGCNMVFNNKDVDKLGRHTISKSTGLLGHVEYTKYNDNSSDLKTYPSILGHRYSSSKLYQDLDGDSKIDRIRINGPEWQMNRIKDILIREYDYEDNQKEFDKGDELLKKYSNQ